MKMRNRLKKLEVRRKAFDDLKADGSGNRPGAIYIKNGHGKYVMYHRPGSNKK